jgi:hypothetical protein
MICVSYNTPKLRVSSHLNEYSQSTDQVLSVTLSVTSDSNDS